MRIKSLIITLFAFAPLLSIAADYDIKVCALQTHDTGSTAFLQVCDDWESKNQCDGNHYVTWNMDEFQGKAMYSSALAAMMSDKEVKVRLDGETCIGLYDRT